MEDLVKHMRQWSSQGLHNLLMSARMAKPRFLPIPIWAGRGDAQIAE